MQHILRNTGKVFESREFFANSADQLPTEIGRKDVKSMRNHATSA